jgi:hypothetical protein
MTKCYSCGEDRKGAIVSLLTDSDKYEQVHMCYDCQNESEWESPDDS